MASDSSSDEDVAKFAAVAVSADALHQQAERSKQASVLGWMPLHSFPPLPPPPLVLPAQCCCPLHSLLSVRLPACSGAGK